ncbi:Interferon-induced protein 44, partial [Nibea albiflora]
YSTYKIEKGGSESFYPFVFNDIMGLDTDKGVLVGDVKLALRGHVKDGYTFDPESKLSKGDQFFKDSPSNNDKVHVLVCVVPASTVSLITDEAVRKIREIRKEASDLDGGVQCTGGHSMNCIFPVKNYHEENNGTVTLTH